jgi:hypothetical protein
MTRIRAGQGSWEFLEAMLLDPAGRLTGQGARLAAQSLGFFFCLAMLQQAVRRRAPDAGPGGGGGCGGGGGGGVQMKRV